MRSSTALLFAPAGALAHGYVQQIWLGDNLVDGQLYEAFSMSVLLTINSVESLQGPPKEPTRQQDHEEIQR